MIPAFPEPISPLKIHVFGPKNCSKMVRMACEHPQLPQILSHKRTAPYKCSQWPTSAQTHFRPRSQPFQSPFQHSKYTCLGLKTAQIWSEWLGNTPKYAKYCPISVHHPTSAHSGLQVPKHIFGPDISPSRAHFSSKYTFLT